MVFFPLAIISKSATSSAVRPRRSNSEYISRSGGAFQPEKEYDYEDMPFAVDQARHVSATGAGPGTTASRAFTKSGAGDFEMSSRNSMSSQVVASLAHRCYTAGLLKLFNNT